MGLIIKGTIPKVPAFSLWNIVENCNIQLIQAVTKLDPRVGGHFINLWKGHGFIHLLPKKVTTAELPGYLVLLQSFNQTIQKQTRRGLCNLWTNRLWTRFGIWLILKNSSFLSGWFMDLSRTLSQIGENLAFQKSLNWSHHTTDEWLQLQKQSASYVVVDLKTKQNPSIKSLGKNVVNKVVDLFFSYTPPRLTAGGPQNDGPRWIGDSRFTYGHFGYTPEVEQLAKQKIKMMDGRIHSFWEGACHPLFRGKLAVKLPGSIYIYIYVKILGCLTCGPIFQRGNVWPPDG